MGDDRRVWLLRRFRRTRAQSLAADVFLGTETLEVVGESHYQRGLWEIVGGFRPDPVRHYIKALLVPEPKNINDANAIAVVVGGRTVGYLSREDAAAYRPGLIRLMASCPTGRVALEGHIVGGGPRRDGVGFLGVFLDHDPAHFGVAPHYMAGGTLRTGLSHAIATDVEDDSYDLSWLRALSKNDAFAIDQLRVLLETESDPIDRHYMLSELAKRLYQGRATASFLHEFDAACGQHHKEMATIRPALLDKFGVVPAIEMYRQAAIRWQKAKQWQEVSEWATRGITVYGAQAARPEFVDDLHKRLANATAKMQASAPPGVSRPARHAIQIETLVCAACGGSFERERTRGRKPKTCPTCRGLAAA